MHLASLQCRPLLSSLRHLLCQCTLSFWMIVPRVPVKMQQCQPCPPWTTTPCHRHDRLGTIYEGQCCLMMQHGGDALQRWRDRRPSEGILRISGSLGYTRSHQDPSRLGWSFDKMRGKTGRDGQRYATTAQVVLSGSSLTHFQCPALFSGTSSSATSQM